MTTQAHPLPATIVTNPTTKEIIFYEELAEAQPDLPELFHKADEPFLANPGRHLRWMAKSIFRAHYEGGEAVCSLLYKLNAVSDQVLIDYAPFADGAPRSSDGIMRRYITPGSPLSKGYAKPGTWNQITKAAAFYDILSAAGLEMPVLTIFPLKTHDYTAEERKKFRAGDFTPVHRITESALAEAQKILPEQPTLERLHFQGASMGASNAVGAAKAYNEEGKRDVASLTTQELIVAPKNVVPQLADSFTLHNTIGEISDIEIPEDVIRIGETALRQCIDKNGTEPLGMIARMVEGFAKWSFNRGLTQAGGNAVPAALTELTDAGIPFVTALAKNSGLTLNTPDYLPGGKRHVIMVEAEKGERTAHLIDEHVALTALVTLLNIRRADAQV